MSVDMIVLFCLLYEIKEDILLLFGWLIGVMAAHFLFISLVVASKMWCTKLHLIVCANIVTVIFTCNWFAADILYLALVLQGASLFRRNLFVNELIWFWYRGKMFGFKMVEVTGGCRGAHNEQLYNLCFSQNMTVVNELRRIRWEEHVACMGDKRIVHTIFSLET
jgi:hypothetical protein